MRKQRLPLIENHQTDIAKLCEQYRVQRLDLIGSAATGEFDPNRSDLDFMVEFLPLERGEHADTYFGLLHGLQDLFGRKIDLVMRTAIRNRWFIRSVESNRELLYAA